MKFLPRKGSCIDLRPLGVVLHISRFSFCSWSSMLAPLSIYSVWHFPFLLNRKRKKEVEIKTTGLLFFFRTTRTFHFHLLLLQLKKKIQRKNKKKRRSPVTLATINNGMDYVPAWIELAQHFRAPSELLSCCW